MTDAPSSPPPAANVRGFDPGLVGKVEHVHAQRHIDEDKGKIFRVIITVLASVALFFFSKGISEWGESASLRASFFMAFVITNMIGVFLATRTGGVFRKIGPYVEIVELVLSKQDDIKAHAKRHPASYGFLYAVAVGLITLLMSFPLQWLIGVFVNPWIAGGFGALLVAAVILPVPLWRRALKPFLGRTATTD